VKEVDRRHFGEISVSNRSQINGERFGADRDIQDTNGLARNMPPAKWLAEICAGNTGYRGENRRDQQRGMLELHDETETMGAW
jgi:hypothetical protein